MAACCTSDSRGAKDDKGDREPLRGCKFAWQIDSFAPILAGGTVAGISRKQTFSRAASFARIGVQYRRRDGCGGSRRAVTITGAFEVGRYWRPPQGIRRSARKRAK